MSLVARHIAATIITMPNGVAMNAVQMVATPVFQNQPVFQPFTGGCVS
jgi:hypothetical protein